MRFLENLKRRFGMAKRFRREKAGSNKIFKEEISAEEIAQIAQRVAEEEIEEIEIKEVIPEGKKSKEEFLTSKGLDARPNSHMAIKAWEEYNAS